MEVVNLWDREGCGALKFGGGLVRKKILGFSIWPHPDQSSFPMGDRVSLPQI